MRMAYAFLTVTDAVVVSSSEYTELLPTRIQYNQPPDSLTTIEPLPAGFLVPVTVSTATVISTPPLRSVGSTNMAKKYESLEESE